jgi:hypothetical protein
VVAGEIPAGSTNQFLIFDLRFSSRPAQFSTIRKSKNKNIKNRKLLSGAWQKSDAPALQAGFKRERYPSSSTICSRSSKHRARCF